LPSGTARRGAHGWPASCSKRRAARPRDSCAGGCACACAWLGEPGAGQRGRAVLGCVRAWRRGWRSLSNTREQRKEGGEGRKEGRRRKGKGKEREKEREKEKGREKREGKERSCAPAISAAAIVAGRPCTHDVRTLHEMGQWSDLVSARGFGEIGLRRKDSKKIFLACDFFGKFSGRHKPTPLKMDLVLEIRLVPKQMGKLLL
jgi:hypothetical protein